MGFNSKLHRRLWSQMSSNNEHIVKMKKGILFTKVCLVLACLCSYLHTGVEFLLLSCLQGSMLLMQALLSVLQIVLFLIG